MKQFVAGSVLFLAFFSSIRAQSGQLDPAFGNNGLVIQDWGTGSNLGGKAEALALQPDGKILAAGEVSFHEVVVARYLPDGQPDVFFGTDGLFKDEQNGVPVLIAVAVQANGRIVAAGSNRPSKAIEDGLVYRLFPDGHPDPSLDNDGLLKVPGFRINALAVQADGRIIVAGNNQLKQFDLNGTLDVNFGTGGSVALGARRGYAMTLQSDGKILVAGYNEGGPTFHLSRFHADGSPDLDFADEGVALADIGDYYYKTYDLAIQPDGKILAGTAHYVARFDPGGALDPAFGDDGIAPVGAPEIALQPDGKIISLDTAQTAGGLDFAVSRLNADGSLDAGFGSSGKIVLDFSLSDLPADAAVQPDGKILILGTHTASSGFNSDPLLLRLLPTLSIGTSDFYAASPAVSVYPNPIGDAPLHLEYALEALTPVSIQLLDASGRVLCTYLENEVKTAGIWQQILPVPAGLPAGRYLLRVQTASNQAAVYLLKY